MKYVPHLSNAIPYGEFNKYTITKHYHCSRDYGTYQCAVYMNTVHYAYSAMLYNSHQYKDYVMYILYIYLHINNLA